MRIHELKLHYGYYDLVVGEDKAYEVRKNDRGFQTRDVLHLREWHDAGDEDYKEDGYTGRSFLAEVTSILHSHEGITEGYVVLGIASLTTE